MANEQVEDQRSANDWCWISERWQATDELERRSERVEKQLAVLLFSHLIEWMMIPGWNTVNDIRSVGYLSAHTSTDRRATLRSTNTYVMKCAQKHQWASCTHPSKHISMEINLSSVPVKQLECPCERDVVFPFETIVFAICDVFIIGHLRVNGNVLTIVISNSYLFFEGNTPPSAAFLLSVRPSNASIDPFITMLAYSSHLTCS